MNEYTLEMKWNWWVEMQCFPQNGLVSNLCAYVPRPKQSQLRNSLPMWDIAPLHGKLPDLGIKGLYYTRGKLGTSLLNNQDSPDFITYDPHCYEHDSRKYDSLHDSHLANYFKSKQICKFLRKNDILDDKNYPKCSVADMNAYRYYLNRIHKDKVKCEHKRFIDEINEKRLWKTAQQNVTKHYFKRLNKEIRLKRSSKARKELAQEKRLKELKPYMLLKKWNKRLAAREQQVKDNNLVREEIALRKKKKYEEVLRRGKTLAMRRPIMTLVKLRDQKVLVDEIQRKKKIADKIKKSRKAENYLLKKNFEQYNKLELHKQIEILNSKGQEVVHQRQALQLARQRRMFDRQLQCRKMNKVPAIEYKKEQDLINQKQEKFEQKVKGGVDYIMQVLCAMDKDKPGHQNRFSQTLQQHNPILTQVARQLIKRAAYVNINFVCRHLTTVVLNYALAPVKNTNQRLPDYRHVDDYFPTEECLNNSGMTMEMKPRTYGLIVDNKKLSDELKQDLDTSGLRAFLTNKHKLLITMLANAKRLFDLVQYRVKLLLSVNDPYNDTPYLKKEIMKARKTMSIRELIEKVVTLLTTTDDKLFDSPLSGLGTIANLLAYSKIMYDRQLITKHDESDHDTTKIPNRHIWKCTLLLHQLLQNQFDKMHKTKGKQKLKKLKAAGKANIKQKNLTIKPKITQRFKKTQKPKVFQKSNRIQKADTTQKSIETQKIISGMKNTPHNKPLKGILKKSKYN